MLINTTKYQFDNLEFHISNEFIISPGTVTPFLLDDLCSNLNLISFTLDNKNNEKFIHVSTRGDIDDSWEALNKEFDGYVEKLNLDVESRNNIVIDGNDAIDAYFGSDEDDLPKIRHVVFRKNNKEYNFIFTTFKNFEDIDNNVNEFFDNLKFIN